MAFKTPEQAETAFYQALIDGDAEAMAAVWAVAAEVACIHPVGPLLSGHAQVTAGWAHILDGGGMRVRHRRLGMLSGGDLAVHTVLEELLRGEEAGAVRVLATNVYRKGPEGWWLVLHHASPVERAEAVSRAAGQVVH